MRRRIICFNFQMTIHSIDDFYTRSSFCSAEPAFMFLCQFGRSFAVYSALGCLHNDDGKEYNGCVSVRYNYLLISLPFFTKQQREIVTFCILKVNYDDQLLPQSVGSFSSFSNGTKRNMTNPSKKYPRNVRVAMSKISLDGLRQIQGLYAGLTLLPW